MLIANIYKLQNEVLPAGRNITPTHLRKLMKLLPNISTSTSVLPYTSKFAQSLGPLKPRAITIK